MYNLLNRGLSLSKLPFTEWHWVLTYVYGLPFGTSKEIQGSYFPSTVVDRLGYSHALYVLQTFSYIFSTVYLFQNFETFIEKHADSMRQLNDIQFLLEEKNIPADSEICRDFIAEHELLQLKIFDIIQNIVPLGESVLADLQLQGEPLPGDPVAAYSMDSALIDVEIAMDGLKIREKTIMDSWQQKKTFLQQCLRFHKYEEGYNKV